MNNHKFIFDKTYWLGEGQVSFSASPEKLHFFTRWEIADCTESVVVCKQLVEMRDQGECINNVYRLSNITEGSFIIELTNDVLGTVSGKGRYDVRTIAWEFRTHENFEGFEVYELQPDGTYIMHAEYASPEQFRTVIDGKIWLKADQ